MPDPPTSIPRARPVRRASADGTMAYSFTRFSQIWLISGPRMFESSSTSTQCLWTALRIFHRARFVAALRSNSSLTDRRPLAAGRCLAHRTGDVSGRFARSARSGSPVPGEGAPDEQDDDRPDHGDHDALDIDPGHVALVEHCLGEVPTHHRPDDAQNDRADHPFASAHDHVREKPCNGAEHDPADDAHHVLLPSSSPWPEPRQGSSAVYGRMWSLRRQGARVVHSRLWLRPRRLSGPATGTGSGGSERTRAMLRTGSTGGADPCLRWTFASSPARTAASPGRESTGSRGATSSGSTGVIWVDETQGARLSRGSLVPRGLGRFGSVGGNGNDLLGADTRVRGE